MKQALLKLWKIVKNKYVASTLLFLVIFLFLGENNLIVSTKLSREVANLERECKRLKADIEQDSIEASSLISNPDALEAYGREHYYMKRPNEDIFIVK